MTKSEAGIVNAFFDNDTSVVAVLRDQDGHISFQREPTAYRMYVRTEDVGRDFFFEITRGQAKQYVRSVRRTKDWVEIDWDSRDSIRMGAKWLEECEVQTYEANVSPLRRWMVDNSVRFVRPRLLFFDIEADSRLPFSRKTEARILCITTCDENLNRSRHLLRVDSDEDEERVLREFWAVASRYDCLVAWNGDGYDFDVIKARTRLRGIDLEFRRWLFLDQMAVFQRQNAMAAESGAEKESYALDAVAQNYNLKGKLDLDASLAWEHWLEDPEKLLEYCARDTDLLLQLEVETGYLELLWTLCDATGVIFDSRGNNPGPQVESFMLRLARERNFRFKTRFPEEGDSEKFKGAFVLHPKRSGLIRDVHVCDFSRMYPSIIVAWNISPETKLPRPVDKTLGMPVYLKGSMAWKQAKDEYRRQLEDIPENVAVAHNGARFRTDVEGILSIGVRELLRLREYWDNLKASLPPGSPEWIEANRRSSAYKIAANSFYGVQGSRASMFFDVEVAEAITQTGAWLIKETHAEARKQIGAETIYSDTDSAFIAGGTDAEFRSFVQHCNDVLYVDLVKQTGGLTGWIKMAYEKKFSKVSFGMTNDDKSLAAKKYAARIEHFKGTRPKEGQGLEIKGFEYKRGDSLAMTRLLQKQLVDAVFLYDCESPEKLAEWVRGWRQSVLEHDFRIEEVRKSQSLSKPLDEYAIEAKKKGIDLGQVEVRRVLKGRIDLFSYFASFLGGSGMIRVPDSEFHVGTDFVRDVGNTGRLVVNDWSVPAIVRIARILLARGREVRVGSKVSWVVKDGSVSPKEVIPAEDYDGTLDRFDLWENSVWPASRRFLTGAFPGYDWNQFTKVRPKKVRAKAARKGKRIPKEQLSFL